MGNSVGKGGKVNKSSAENGLLDISSALMAEISPLRKEVIGQTLESLQTGGIGARLPIVQKGIEASRAATSSALSQLDEGMARQGLGQSGYANALRAQTLLSGELETQAIPQRAAEQFIAIAPSLASGFTGQGLQGFSTSGGLANQRSGIQAQRDIAKGQQQVEYIKAIGSIAGAAAGCWIAARLYGWGSREFQAARYFIFVMWQGRMARLCQHVYLRYGERLAAHPWLCRLLKPLFNVAVKRGLVGLRLAGR